ncbi:hypothetical protein GW755_01140 [bacterium]|nr:hypothetical protein [bacterium]
MPDDKSPNLVKKYILDINENSIKDISKVSEKNRKGVEEIIALKKKRAESPKTYYVNGNKIENSEKKVQGLLKKLTEKNPDLAYESNYNLLQLSNVKFIFALSIILGITYTFGIYFIYQVFRLTYHLPYLPQVSNFVIGALAGIASYEIILKKKEEELNNLLLKGIILDVKKEYARQKNEFAFEIAYFTPVLVFALLIVEYVIILAVF